MASELQANTVGALFRTTVYDVDDLTSPLDISDSGPSPLTSKTVLFEKPSGAVVEKSLLFVTDGTDGQLVYEFVAGDLDEIGNWGYQVFLEFNDGSEFPGNVGAFEVKENIEIPPP